MIIPSASSCPLRFGNRTDPSPKGCPLGREEGSAQLLGGVTWQNPSAEPMTLAEEDLAVQAPQTCVLPEVISYSSLYLTAATVQTRLISKVPAGPPGDRRLGNPKPRARIALWSKLR